MFCVVMIVCFLCVLKDKGSSVYRGVLGAETEVHIRDDRRNVYESGKESLVSRGWKKNKRMRMVRN